MFPNQYNANETSISSFNPKSDKMNPSFNHIFLYSGGTAGLQKKIDALTAPDLKGIKEINITCLGQQIKPYKPCYVICTGIWGALFIFPLLFMCCNWWKKIVMPVF